MTDERTEFPFTRDAWYGLWSLDAYALGPFRFKRPVTEAEAREHMTSWAGEPPKQLWPA